MNDLRRQYSRPQQTFERWTPRTHESPSELARQSEAKRKQAPQSEANVCRRRRTNAISKKTSLTNCTEHPTQIRGCNICKPEEGWNGQPKYCYKKQYTLFEISFAVVFGLLVLVSSSCFLFARKTQVFWHQSEARTAATVWNWSSKTLSPGALLAVLYFSSCHIFPPV